MSTIRRRKKQREKGAREIARINMKLKTYDLKIISKRKGTDQGKEDNIVRQKKKKRRRRKKRREEYYSLRGGRRHNTLLDVGQTKETR